MKFVISLEQLRVGIQLVPEQRFSQSFSHFFSPAFVACHSGKQTLQAIMIDTIRADFNGASSASHNKQSFIATYPNNPAETRLDAPAL